MSISGSLEYFFALSDAPRVFDAIATVAKPAPKKNRPVISMPDGSTIVCRFAIGEVSFDCVREGRIELTPLTQRSDWILFTIDVACEVDRLGDYFEPGEFEVFRRQSDHARVVFMTVDLSIRCGEKYLNVSFGGESTTACVMMDLEADALSSKLEGVYSYGNGVLSLRECEGEYEFIDANEAGTCQDFYGAPNSSFAWKLDEFVDRYRNPSL